MGMKYADLERYEKLSEEDTEEAWWAALVALEPHLEDLFIEVDSVLFERGIPGRLASFRAPNGELCYVATNDAGNVILGRIQEGKQNTLSHYIQQPLGDFDWLRDEIRSIAVSETQRYSGDTLDLWIMVRRYAKPHSAGETEYRLYHGIIAVKGAEGLALRIPQDDLSQTAPAFWQPEKVAFPSKRVPSWLYRWNFSAGTQDIAAIPKNLQRFLPANDYTGIDAMAFSDAWFCYAHEQTLCCFQTQHRYHYQTNLELPARIYALALLQIRDGLLYGMAGCSDQSLCYFRVKPNENKLTVEKIRDQDGLATTQPRYIYAHIIDTTFYNEYPSALSLMDNTPAADRTGYSTYDLLVLDRSNRLTQWRIMASERLHQLWKRCLERLRLTDPDTIFQAHNWSAERGVALTYAALDACLRDRQLDSAATRRAHMEKLLKLLHGFRGEGYFPRRIWRKLVSLPSYMATARQKTFQMELLYRVYTRELSAMDRRRVTSELAGKAWKTLDDDPWLARLRREITAGNWATSPLRPLARLGELLEQWSNDFYVDGVQAKLSRLPKAVTPNNIALLEWEAGNAPTTALLVAAAQGKLVGFDPTRDKRRLFNIRGFKANHPVERLLALPEGLAVQLAVLESGGQKPGVLSLLRLVADRGGWRAELCHHLPLDIPGFPLLLCAVPGPGHTALLAVLANRGRYAELLSWKIDGEQVQSCQTQFLPIPWISSADLAYDGNGGYRLAVATNQARAARLYRLAADGRCQEEGAFDIMQRGVNALAFSSQQTPRWLMVGGSDGSLLCVDLAAAGGTPALHWTGCLEGAVTFLRGLPDGESFLAGTLKEELYLLRINQGQWERCIHLPGAVETAVVGSRTPRGWVWVRGAGIYELVYPNAAQQDKLLQEIKQELQQIESVDSDSDSDAWRIDAPARAVWRVARNRKSPFSVLDCTEEREARTALIRYLLKTDGVAAADKIHWAEHQRLYELYNLLNPGAANTAAVLPAIMELLRHELNPDDEAANAMLAVLHHLAGRQPGIEQLIDTVPQHYVERHYSVARELARLLLQAARTEMINSDGGILPILLPTLYHLPLNTILELTQLVQPGSEEKRQFDALAVLLDPSQHADAIGNALDELERHFAAVEQNSELNRFTAALLRFHRLYWSHTADTASLWADWRERALAAVAGLIGAVHADWTPDPPKAALLHNLRASLANRPPPADSEPREQGLAWVEAMRRQLEFGTLEPPPAMADGWETLLWRLVELTRMRLQQLFKQEYDYQLALSRPRLEVLEIQRLEDNRLRLRLRATPEAGSRPLSEASVSYRCQLSPPGHAQEQRRYLHYPPLLKQEELDFDGFLLPNQTELAITTTLVTAKGYRNQSQWRFPLPKLKREAETKDWPPALERIYSDYRERLFGLKTPLAMASIDAGMGYHELLKDWSSRPGTRLIDLDQRLAAIGPGRRYAGRALDVDALLEPLLTEMENTLDSGRHSTTTVWVLAPLGETLERLFQAGAVETVQSWLEHLREIAAATPARRLRLIVSSRHAARLRALGVAGLTETALHRHLLHSRDQTLREALRDLLVECYATPAQQAAVWLEAMGWDLRLANRWLRQRENRGSPLGFREFLNSEEIRQILREDLASLGVLELATVMAGAVSQCQILLQHTRPGQHSARDYFSTTREKSNAPKLLQRRGSPFSNDSLARLHADAAPPGHVLVEGFGGSGASESAHSGLLPMLLLRRKELEATVYRHLAEVGLGNSVGGIFRSASPYREYITECYAAYGTPGQFKPDAQVLSQLAGADRDPGELLRPEDLVHATKDNVAQFLPNSEANERDKLRAIARVWQPGTTQDAVLPALQRLFPHSQTLLKLSGTTQWITPLLEFGLACLGIGKVELRRQDGSAMVEEPEDYLFWLADAGHFDYAAFRTAVAERLERRANWLKNQGYVADTHTPKILLSGPGVESLPLDPGRALALWRFADYARAAWRGGSLVEGLWARARAQLRLTVFSPYRTSGGLPPGSPLFVGREKELDFIRQKLPVASILVVGCRRVGKTSLLNRVWYELQNHPDLLPIYLDLQGIRQRTEFLHLLRDATDNFPLLSEQLKGSTSQDDVRGVMEKLALTLKQQGKLPVFLLNEVDGLAENEPELLEIFRGFNDRGAARFLFVGYSVIRQLGEIKKPLFHFTEGLSFGDKAISLAELSPAAAERLLDQLTAKPLALRWRNSEERRLAHGQLLARSYRIPWVLQRYGKLLVEQLEKQRHEEISLEDVERLLHINGNVVWEYISQIDYATLGYKGDSEKAQKPGFLIVLYALARKFYFQGDSRAPVRDPRLYERRALDLGFRTGEVLEAVRESVYLLLKGEEQRVFMDWFNRLDLNQALKLLTLTLILEPDPAENERYGFLLHIFPLELYRLYGASDPTLDDLIIKATDDFLRIMQPKERH